MNIQMSGLAGGKSSAVCLWKEISFGEFQRSEPDATLARSKAHLKSRAWHTSPVRHQAGAEVEEILRRCGSVAASAVD
jgi:hypothetical protein